MEPGERLMPTDSLIVTVGVIVAFAVFAIVLAWADRRTHKTHG